MALDIHPHRARLKDPLTGVVGVGPAAQNGSDARDEFGSKGVDSVACISVNDAFVMGAWADSQGVGKEDILMLADGNGDFTRAVGLSLDGKGFGMGERSQRYSMLVNDGVVEQLNIEQGGEFKVSSAEHLLAQL